MLATSEKNTYYFTQEEALFTHAIPLTPAGHGMPILAFGIFGASIILHLIILSATIYLLRFDSMRSRGGSTILISMLFLHFRKD